MKEVIIWHEECLKNSKHYYEEQLKKLNNLKEEILKHKEWIEFAEYQLNEAKKEGKESFDAEKYKVKKHKL